MNLEHVLRSKLSKCHDIIQKSGWDDLLATHLSARISGEHKLLISPHNVLFENVTPLNLVTCDFSGQVVGEDKE